MPNGDRGKGPTTRGRPLKVIQPTALGCVGGFLLVLMGLGTLVLAHRLVEGAPLALKEIVAAAVMLLGGLAAFAGGVALTFKAMQERVLVFENGLVRRDWRGHDRFVPWERLRALEMLSGMTGATGTLVAWIDPEDGSGEPEKLTLTTTIPTAQDGKDADCAVVADLAERAGLAPAHSGRLSWGGQTWCREDADEK